MDPINRSVLFTFAPFAAIFLMGPALASSQQSAWGPERAQAADPALVGGSSLLHVSDFADRHSVVHHDIDAAGVRWARGRGYKARVDGAGFTFIPFLGSDAPRNFPVRFQLRDVVRGAESALLGKAPAVSRTQDRVVIDRGSVRVQYDLGLEGAEQSFEVDRVPGKGDLVLVLDVETDFAASQEGEGLRFTNERGGVDYGAAVAFDAAGRRIEVTVAWQDGTIQLTVPASFLGDAEWPILVDPLLTPITVGGLAASLGSPAVDYGFGLAPFASGAYCVAVEEQFSAADTDVFCWLVSTTGAGSVGGYVDQTTADWSSPQVCRELGAPEFQIVAEVDSVAVPGSKDIAGRKRLGGGGFGPVEVLISATPSFSCASPQIAVDGFGGPAPSFFLVAYNRIVGGVRDVHLFTLRDGVVLSQEVISANPFTDCSAPAMSGRISASSLATGWAERHVATGASTVWSAEVRFDGQVVYGPFLVAGPSTTSLYYDVAVSLILTGPYLVTFDDRLSSLEDAIVGLCSQGITRNVVELQQSEHASRTPNQNDLRVITGSESHFLGYVENGELLVTTLQAVNLLPSIVERRQVAAGANVVPRSLAAADRTFSTSGPDDGGMFVWIESIAGMDNLRAVEVFPPSAADEGAGVQFCFGTANSTGDHGFIRASGDRRTDSLHMLHVEALPPTTFGYWLASLDDGEVLNAGGSQGTLCLGGDIGRFSVYQSDAAGTASYVLDPAAIQQPTGLVSAAVGDRWKFQSWFRDSVGGVPTSNFTNAVQIRFR